LKFREPMSRDAISSELCFLKAMQHQLYLEI
jgi:hypothetical protein